MSQDIVLVSNASMDLYPENKLSDFRVRLPQTLTFDQSYRVGITRISFTKSYFNYEHPHTTRKYWIIISETKAPYDPDAISRTKCRVGGYAAAGYYTPETFVKMIDQCAKDTLITGTDKQKTQPSYSLKNDYLVVVPGIFINANGHEIKYQLDFDQYTRRYIGISDHETPRPVFINQGFTDLYVYSDIVYPSIVGDQNCELLTIIDGQTAKPFGSHCSETFEDPWFHELARSSFSDVRVYIRTDNGEAPNFRFGRVSLRLSFKKQDVIR